MIATRSIAIRKARKNSTYFFTDGLAFSTRSSAAWRARKSRSALIVATRFAIWLLSAACQTEILLRLAAIAAAIWGRARFSAAAAAAARPAARLEYGPPAALWVCEQAARPASQSARKRLFVTWCWRLASLACAAAIAFCAAAILASYVCVIWFVASWIRCVVVLLNSSLIEPL